MKLRTLIATSLVLALTAALALAQYGSGKNNKPKQPADTRSLEGKKAPDFTLPMIDGQDLKLSEQKGNVVVLDFWATWCGPCVKALPHVQELASDTELAQKGLKVYAVNMTTWKPETEEKAREFVKANNYTFPVPLDREGKLAESYKIQGIPTQVVIGRDGMIKKVFVGDGGENLTKAIEQALRAKAPGNAKGPATKPSSEG
jgi:peroxiredoxin